MNIRMPLRSGNIQEQRFRITELYKRPIADSIQSMYCIVRWDTGDEKTIPKVKIKFSQF